MPHTGRTSLDISPQRPLAQTHPSNSVLSTTTTSRPVNRRSTDYDLTRRLADQKRFLQWNIATLSLTCLGDLPTLSTQNYIVLPATHQTLDYFAGTSPNYALLALATRRSHSKTQLLHPASRRLLSRPSWRSTNSHSSAPLTTAVAQPQYTLCHQCPCLQHALHSFRRRPDIVSRGRDQAQPLSF